MTQDTVSSIKHRVEEFCDIQPSPFDYMSAVAQYYLDSSPDTITWKSITIALLNADEINLAHQIFDNLSESSTSACKTTVKSVMRAHYYKLKEVTENCLEKVADKLYSRGLINLEVRKMPTFNKIDIEFSALISLHTNHGNESELEKICDSFLSCIASVGGPAKEEAIALARDWKNRIFKNHQILFSLTEFDPKVVQLSSNDNLAIELQNLHKKYAKLITDIITYYASSGKHDAIVIARWVQSAFDETGLARDHVTIDEIFERMQPHHSFIDIDTINDLIENYPIDDDLQDRFDKYSDEVNEFIDSVKLDDIYKTIEAAVIGESTKGDPKVILKLSGKWNDKTIGHLHKLLKYLFDEEAKCVTIKKFLRGSICIQFLVSSNRSVKSLIMKSQAKLNFLHFLGIFQLIVDNQTIIDRDEDISFTFEESLLESIASIESNVEYNRLSLLLIELRIKLNYQNTHGKNALMLTSEGGHIGVFKSLLLNGAYPFVQLPANEGFIGLNSLACTALSEHIYKSIGGEKIIPEAGTSVRRMLEMAVMERRVGWVFLRFYYNSFLDIIENNLKERFQWLQNCFRGLKSAFLDTATKTLTSKAMVTEARQKFRSFIEEDADCENAHQLLQLLEPHYSYWNVNILRITSAITKPIKEQLKDYDIKLNMFKDTTTTLEFAIMTEGIPHPSYDISETMTMVFSGWSSVRIAALNTIESFFCSPYLSYLNLVEIRVNDSYTTIVAYRMPQSEIQKFTKNYLENRDSFGQMVSSVM
ncbi:PREDICTED: uncharacterized protein LOC109591094 [Amphimedon queenslandica]|nr:PREDICTED: uncharacterized protein LOC109591094 [Amphimedon queenslandica]|eukprot:XP_019862457.1 PREDICTED: uncharacterized protein LOC109591094 [Amphimedon queenslandica]